MRPENNFRLPYRLILAVIWQYFVAYLLFARSFKQHPCRTVKLCLHLPEDVNAEGRQFRPPSDDDGGLGGDFGGLFSIRYNRPSSSMTNQPAEAIYQENHFAAELQVTAEVFHV